MGNRFANGYTNIAWPAPANVVAYSTTRDSELPITPNEPAWIKQVHGINVACADQATSNVEADASYTTKANTVCIIKTADCLPILICNKDGSEVAAIHAGWRGLAAGVIDSTCGELAATNDNYLAWLGPAIGPQKFEVGQDVLENFFQHDWDLDHGFTKQADKWLVDLYTLARLNLQKLGFSAENIYGGDWCTYSDPERFYSYRRSKDTDRMMHLIWFK